MKIRGKLLLFSLFYWKEEIPCSIAFIFSVKRLERKEIFNVDKDICFLSFKHPT